MLTNSNKTNWDRLSMADRTNYIKLGLNNGISDLKVIRDTYNKYADGGNSKQGYIREDLQNPISFDSEGNLTDQVTGEKGMIKLPEVIVTPKRYSSAFDGSYDNFREGLNAFSGGAFDYIPVVGDALDVSDVANDIYKKDYTTAALGLGLLAVPNVVEKPLKKIGKYLSKQYNKLYANTKLLSAELFPNKFSKEVNIKDLPGVNQEDIDYFYKNDVYPRFLELDEYNRNLTSREKYTLGELGRQLTPIRTYKGGKNYIMGASDGNTIFINNEHKRFYNSEDLESTLVHELEHDQRSRIARDNISRNVAPLKDSKLEYTDKEVDALSDAYRFSPSYDSKNKHYIPVAEASATNRQLRYSLYKKTGKTGKELDKVIDNMKDVDIGYLLSELQSSYSNEFLRNIYGRHNAIKYAMKTVPILSAPLLLDYNSTKE